MPRGTLTREKIVKAAVDLLDTDGLEGFNIRALGRPPARDARPPPVAAAGLRLLPGVRPGQGPARRPPLAIYEAAGFSGARADQAAASVFTLVLGNALGAAADASLTRRLSRDGGNAAELIRDHVAQATELAAQFPRRSSRGSMPDWGPGRTLPRTATARRPGGA
jgi:hypothetical protein